MITGNYNVILLLGEMMMSILWFYRPEHTDIGRQPEDLPIEVFASKHRYYNTDIGRQPEDLFISFWYWGLWIRLEKIDLDPDTGSDPFSRFFRKYYKCGYCGVGFWNAAQNYQTFPKLFLRIMDNI